MEVNIDDFINQVQNQDFSKATVTFSDLMDTKVSDALEQEKISMADQIFNGAEAEEESTDESTEEESETEETDEESSDEESDESKEEDSEEESDEE